MTSVFRTMAYLFENYVNNNNALLERYYYIYYNAELGPGDKGLIVDGG